MKNLECMDEQSKTEYYNKYKHVCAKVASDIAKAKKFEIDELKSEAYLILTTCIDNYDVNRNVPFINYLRNALVKGLERFCKDNPDSKCIYNIDMTKKNVQKRI